MEVAVDSDAVDFDEVSGMVGLSTAATSGPGGASLVDTFKGSDITPRAAMAMGLHRLAVRVREWIREEGQRGSVGWGGKEGAAPAGGQGEWRELMEGEVQQGTEERERGRGVAMLLAFRGGGR